MTAAIQITDFKPRTSGTLRAFLSVTPPSGIVLHELTLHTRNGQWWVSFPARPVVVDGVVQRDDAGKVRYGPPLISFASRAARDRFNGQVIQALRQAQPQLFAEEAVG